MSTPTIDLTHLLNNFTTLQAHFSQTTEDVSHTVIAQSEGVVAIQRPGKFRWEAEQPTHQIVITSGHTLWIYDVDLKQAIQVNLDQGVINPARLLSGKISTLLKEFSVKEIGDHDATIFQLTPKKTNDQFRSVSILFRHNHLAQMKINTTLAQTSVFDFSKVVLNGRLSPDIFIFTPPSGVTIL